MSYALRPATVDDLALVLPRTRALNAHEGITTSGELIAAALRGLLDNPALGGVWLVGEPIVGYAIVTYGYDLEFAGREAWLTELWIDEPARGQGAGAAALAALEDELPRLGVRALHLQVRPENPAVRLYERAGFAASPRLVMTKRF